MKKSVFLIAGFMFASSISAIAEEPSGYYDSAEGKSSQALLKQLSAVIKNHTNVGYDGLYNVYSSSDVRPDGTLWDIYSTKRWKVSKSNQCGNYKNVGDCYNREHSVPQSWFNSASPMKSDAFHVYPTDGKVNGQRSNYPYGECANGTSLGTYNGVTALGKLGSSTFPGFSGKVFEPDDEYKGDLARTYFYMATAYNDKISNWSSPAFAGNNYPVFSSWTIDLLLKWHRQDPVSQKEIDRNEAIYKHQKNRNPYIDHPELVEYVWGNKKGTGWYVNSTIEPEIIAPLSGSEINIGTASVGVTRSQDVAVLTAGLQSSLKLSVSGTGFSVTPQTVTASAANNGTSVKVSFTSADAVNATGTLTLECGDVVSKVRLTASAVNGLPAGPAKNVASNSFVATWSCIDDPETIYTLNVAQNGVSLEEYPMQVRAGDEASLVENLDPETTYTYTVSSATLTSEPVSVTTAEQIPYVGIMFDGDLFFSTEPGTPSEAAELLLDIDNIPGDIEIAVSSPFEVSTDKSTWGQSATVSTGADRFYMRLNGMTAGAYATNITITADNYFSDDVEVEGVIGEDEITFFEDFEAAPSASTYGNHTYVSTHATWQMSGIYIENGSNAYPRNGKQAGRFRLKNNGCMTMTTSKPNGAGTITLWSRLWGSDSADGAFEVNVSSDGQTWEKAGEITIKATPVSRAVNEYAEYTLPIKKAGNVYLQIKQTKGDRIMVDDIAVSDHKDTSTLVPEYEYHTWDAFCRNGSLVIENALTDNAFSVYSMEGIEVFAGKAAVGETVVDLPAGLYIVSVRDFSRRVLVK